MVVPRDDEWRRGVRGEQIAIGLVQGVAVTVVDERERFLADVIANAIAAARLRGPFVDVVAGVKDEIELLFGDAPERREVTLFVVAAAAHGKANPIDGGPGGPGGARSRAGGGRG